MNERIKELVVESGNGQMRDGKLYPHIGSRTQEDWEKFAELIVKECIAQCESNSPEVDQWTDEHVLGEHFAVNECVLSIKQHFGVEE